MKIPFLSCTCDDIGVAMVTNMISQLQERFLLRHAASSSEISFTKCLGGTVTGDFLDKLPNFHIDTFSKLEEHSERFATVSESDVEKFTWLSRDSVQAPV